MPRILKQLIVEIIFGELNVLYMTSVKCYLRTFMRHNFSVAQMRKATLASEGQRPIARQEKV